MRRTDFCNRHLDTSTRSNRSILESSRAAAFAPSRDFHAPQAEVIEWNLVLTTSFQLRQACQWASANRGAKRRADLIGLPIEGPPPCAPLPAAFSAVGSSCEPTSDTLCHDASFEGLSPHEEEESPRPASAAVSSKTPAFTNQDAFHRRHAHGAAFASPASLRADFCNQCDPRARPRIA